MRRSDEFVEASRELRESRILGMVGAAAGVMAIAARHSRVASATGRGVRAFRSLPPPARLRLVLLTLVVAIATHMVLAFFLPRRVAPAWLPARVQAVSPD